MLSHIRIILLFWTLLTLNGCKFWSSEQQRWILNPEGSIATALSRDSQFAFTHSKQDGLVLWDLPHHQPLLSLAQHDFHSEGIILTKIADLPRFALTATTQSFAVWDLAWGQAQGLWTISDSTLTDAALSSNGEQVLLGLANSKVIHVNLGTGRRLEFLAHNKKVSSVALSPNGRYALSGGDDNRAYLWDTDSGQALFQFIHPAAVRHVALHRDGQFAFTADAEGNGYLWQLQNGEKSATLQTSVRPQAITVARFSDDGTLLVTATAGRQISLWRTQDGKKLKQWYAAPKQNTRPPHAVVYDVSIDPDGRVSAATSAGIVQAWQAE
ncbi:WD40 repeat domain-containing protein [Thaumasiovibrio sp. DFM-14]|uniref:WD40 repeat domain-containing protein n=1 Tax=Thaumasiovibrio sp. DFM-14 TaxID=3384792 RepID=UPI00399F9332